jgi:hypothetical protein
VSLIKTDEAASGNTSNVDVDDPFLVDLVEFKYSTEVYKIPCCPTLIKAGVAVTIELT